VVVVVSCKLGQQLVEELDLVVRCCPQLQADFGLQLKDVAHVRRVSDMWLVFESRDQGGLGFEVEQEVSRAVHQQVAYFPRHRVFQLTQLSAALSHVLILLCSFRQAQEEVKLVSA
jgi:hypothetical protein